MPQVVEVPGYGDVEFPDGMTDDQIATAIRQNMEVDAPKPKRFGSGKSFDVTADGSLAPTGSVDYTKQNENDRSELSKWGQAMTNVGQTGAQMATGFPAAVLGQVGGLGATAYDITANAVMHPFSGSDPGSFADPTKVKSSIQDYLTYRPDDPNSLVNKIANYPGKVIQGTGEELAAPVDHIPYAGSIARGIPEALASYMGMKGISPATVTNKVPYATGGAKSVITKATGSALPKQTVPTTAELKTAKDAAYKAADDANVVIKPASTQKAVEIFRGVAKAENLGELPTEMGKAVKILEDRIKAKEPLSLSDADKVRQRISDAMKSNDPADVRMGSLVKKQYDEYLESLSADDVLSGNTKDGLAILKQARELHGRLKRSEMLDEMEALASLKAESNYTQAGHEHALRKQFEGLTSKAIKGDEYLTPAQLAAVRKVAAPGPAANALRNVSKLDPARGGMSQGLNTIVGGGLGGALGSVLGPAGAGAGAIAGTAALGVGANLASRGALRGTLGRVGNAREALVGPGMPSNLGLLAKPKTAQSASQSRGLLGNMPTRQPSEIQAEIQRLGDRVRFDLANENASSPRVVAAIAELQSLQRELAAIQANQ